MDSISVYPYNPWQKLNTLKNPMKITTSMNQVGGESETGKPKKCACKCRIVIVVVLAVLVIGAICGHIFYHSRSTYSDDPSVDFALKPGLRCTVHLRGVALEGRLIAVNDEAILLDITHQAPKTFIVDGKRVPRHVLIPKSNILFIDYFYPDGNLVMIPSRSGGNGEKFMLE